MRGNLSGGFLGWNSSDGIRGDRLLPPGYSGVNLLDVEQAHVPTTSYRFVSFLLGAAAAGTR
jgi:hypothetical protein